MRSTRTSDCSQRCGGRRGTVKSDVIVGVVQPGHSWAYYQRRAFVFFS